MCEFHGSNNNGLGDIWWTDKFIYFSIIDFSRVHVFYKNAIGLFIMCVEVQSFL